MTLLVWLLRILAIYWLLRIVVTVVRIRKAEFAVSPASHPESPARPAKVTVCVPARNESSVIGRCVRSVLAQDWPNFDFVVVDDKSEDGTSDLAQEAGGGDPRLRIVPGDGPPPGWMGKAAACWRARQEADGEWLLFVDADVADGRIGVSPRMCAHSVVTRFASRSLFIMRSKHRSFGAAYGSSVSAASSSCECSSSAWMHLNIPSFSRK